MHKKTYSIYKMYAWTFIVLQFSYQIMHTDTCEHDKKGSEIQLYFNISLNEIFKIKISILK